MISLRVTPFGLGEAICNDNDFMTTPFTYDTLRHNDLCGKPN